MKKVLHNILEVLRTIGFIFVIPFLPILVCGIRLKKGIPSAFLLKIREFLVVVYAYVFIILYLHICSSSMLWVDWVNILATIIIATCLFGLAIKNLFGCFKFTLPKIEKAVSPKIYSLLISTLKELPLDNNREKSDYLSAVKDFLKTRDEEVVESFYRLWEDLKTHVRPIACAVMFLLFIFSAILGFSLLYYIGESQMAVTQALLKSSPLDFLILSFHVMAFGDGPYYPVSLIMKLVFCFQYCVAFFSLIIFLPLIFGVASNTITLSESVTSFLKLVFSEKMWFITVIAGALVTSFITSGTKKAETGKASAG